MARHSAVVRDGDDTRLFGDGDSDGVALLSHPQGSTDPRLWHMLIERQADGAEFKLPPLERPVLYERGTD